MRPYVIFLLGVALAISFAAPAQEPRRLAHYVHQRWIEGSEAPVPIVAIAQGRDGFLWLATGDGLFRFDGQRFESIPVEAGRAGQGHGPPSALLVTRDGGVWTSFETSRRFAVYRRGALRLLEAPAAPTRIVEMKEGADGSIWALTANYNAEVLRYHDGTWRTYDADDGLPKRNAANMLVAADGAVWIACSTAIARLPPGGERFEVVHHALRAKVSQDPAGRIWVSEPDATYPITGPGGRGAPEPLHAPHRTGSSEVRGTPVFDGKGNLWLATRYDGVKRLPAPGASRDGGVEAESFTSREGLSSDVTNQVMEDREGNLWVATEGGLDRFRPSTLIAEPALSSPAAFGDKLLDASDGSVYVGQARTLYRIAPGGEPSPVLHDLTEPESLCEAPDGAIWVGLATRILVWANGRVRETIERPDLAASHNIIYDCAFDAHGAYWISAAGSGVHRYRDGRWQTLLQPGDQVDFYPTTMVRSPRGGVVVQSGNRLVWMEDAGQTLTRLDFGASDLKVLTLYTTGAHVFAAGAFGLSRHGADGVRTAWAPQVSQGSRINGIVRTPQGDTWLAYPKSLVRMTTQELERAFADKVLPVPTLSLGPGDGLASRPHSHSQRSMVRGGDGRLWVATETGTLWMDPARIVRNTVAPAVVIRAIDGDGRRYRDPATVKLPAATSKIEIDFAVLSFADQRRVSVRYMLEGFDRDWVDPGTRRQAFYTNLPPGAYRFRVIAANSNGVWNRTGATLAFDIPPAFVQSRWFLLLCAVVAIAVLWGIYRLRVAQIAARIRSRLEERTEERERIARELHDTLLQGVQGLILRFQAVADRIQGDDRLKGRLESALAAADDVVVDARNRVRDLRAVEGTGDVCEIVERIVADTPFDPPIPVRIVVEGKPRPVHPLVAAEVAKVVREALLNIAHHAQASSADIEIGYEARHLAIRMRDDGIGIPAHVVVNGRKDGHYGMVGMRERAAKIGGAITVSSIQGEGAEVILTLPARLAFAKPGSRRRFRLPRFLRRSAADE